ncbi:MAG: methylenetetrahydrofolate reductase [Clostridia bacterium]|nr:methylenetetrahydrofolate reductase [Clostridia bacterium]
MSLLKEAFDSGKFGVTAEMAPPKGWDFSHQLADAELLKGKVHGINVTDMQSASMKATSLGLCIKLKEMGAEPIIQMTGRDRSRMVIMAEMLSAYAFGIDTMLALTGDHPTVGDIPNSKPVYDLDSVGILNMLSTMEVTGRDCGGNPLAGNTVDKDSGEITDKSATPKFYKGACVTPVYEPMFLQINKLKQKVDAGAEYVQTQGIFDLEYFKRFMDEVDKAGIKTHIMAGIIPLKAAGMAKYMNQNVPGIDVPQSMIDRLAAAAAEGKEKGIKGLPMKMGVEMAAEMVAEIKAQGLCDGVHIMAIGAEKNVPVILEKAGIDINA